MAMSSVLSCSKYACPGTAAVFVQVRLKKEVLDESIRANAKQRALEGATSLNGDQWYVQQASRSAPTCTTHSLDGVSVQKQHLRVDMFTLGHLSDLHKEHLACIYPKPPCFCNQSINHVVSQFAPPPACVVHGYSSKWSFSTETLQQGFLVKQCPRLCCGVAEQ